MKYFQDYSLDELKTIKKNFKYELERAAINKKSSLSSIKTKIPDIQVKKNALVQVMVFGGTNYKVANIERRRDKILIKDIKQGKIPDITSEEKFLGFIDSIINVNTDYLAVNLAYPMKQYCRKNIIDAKTGCFNNTNKSYYFPGKYLGESLEDHIYSKQKKRIQVSVGHDITCLVLSALGLCDRDSLICCVLGTGVNAGLYKDKSTITNLESGRFDKFKLSETGEIVDKQSDNTGKYLFEKETAGRYLFKHYNVFAEEYRFKKIINTEELSFIAESNDNSIEVESARNIFKRSASIFACKLAAIIDYKNLSRISFVMEGSLFWKGWKYKDLVFKNLKMFGIEDDRYEFIEINNSSILGAARLFIR